MNDILEFRGNNYFLSNYFIRKVTYNGLTYLNNEAAFHAQKDLSRSAEFAMLPPNEAKKLGRKVNLRTDWEISKVAIMTEVNKAKFNQNPDLKAKLLNTGNAKLVEGNTWGDKFWGVDKNTNMGQNVLGEILMTIRQELK